MISPKDNDLVCKKLRKAAAGPFHDQGRAPVGKAQNGLRLGNVGMAERHADFRLAQHQFSEDGIVGVVGLRHLDGMKRSEIAMAGAIDPGGRAVMDQRLEHKAVGDDLAIRVVEAGLAPIERVPDAVYQDFPGLG
ncbi:hypothetical protein U8P76_34640 (plasmid) [Rhizobium johnstonii]|nr:hypothetical protein U8P76_34640 [Rhizobium johnstonii]